MKIAVITDFFLPKFDGVAVRTANHIKCLASQGEEAILFCTDPNMKTYCGVEIFGLPGIYTPLYPDWKMAIPTMKMFRKLKQFRPDVVHVICPTGILGLSGIMMAKILNLPLVTSFHTYYTKFVEKAGYPYLSPLVFYIQRFFHNQGRITITVSEYTLQDLDRHGYKELRLWPVAVDTELFNPKRASQTTRKLIQGDDPSKSIMLYVGRLSTEKNIQFLREVIKYLPHVKLVIVGDGPIMQELRLLFKGTDTEFMGNLSGEELAKVYSSADLFISPSIFETQGLTAIEAMASGCPVVIANVGGYQSTVQNGYNGYLFAPDDLQSALVVINKMLYDEENRKQMIENARNYICNKTWDEATKKIRDYYTEAICFQ